MAFILRPSEWEVDHARPILAGMAYQAEHNGELPATPMWRALERRCDLAPARFERWHPNLSLMIREARETPYDPPPCFPIVCTPPPCESSHGASQHVPEPAACVLLAVGIAWAYWRATG